MKREAPRISDSARGDWLSFTVLLHPKAARSIKKVQASVRSRILASMKELELRPEKEDQLKPSHSGGYGLATTGWFTRLTGRERGS